MPEHRFAGRSRAAIVSATGVRAVRRFAIVRFFKLRPHASKVAGIAPTSHGKTGEIALQDPQTAWNAEAPREQARFGAPDTAEESIGGRRRIGASMPTALQATGRKP